MIMFHIISWYIKQYDIMDMDIVYIVSWLMVNNG